MAPEQWSGGECNERTDIFALGLVLCEMATGERADPAASPAELTKRLPEQFGHIIERCLEREPEDRWQSAKDVKSVLEWAAKPRPQTPASKSPWRLVAAAAAMGVLATAAASLLWRGPRPQEQTYVASISLAPGTSLHQYAASRLALSPDGRYLVTASAGGGPLVLRSLEQDSSKPLAGTEDAATPFWSPDGSQIGFFARNELKRVNRSGGPPITLARADGSNGGSWNRDGVILFGSYLSALQRVSASGGAPAPATSLDKEAGQAWHSRPFFLPDSNHFLYTVQGTKTGALFDPAGIFAGSLSSNRSKLILAGGSQPQYAQGYLFYMRRVALMAQQFDVDRLELKGEAVVVAQGIANDLASGNQQGAFSLSQTGALVYQPGQSAPLSQLFWYDRSGNQIGTLGEKTSYATYTGPQISPDGERVAVIVDDPLGGTDIWIIDVARGARTRLTTGARLARGPVWLPDGTRILFRTSRNGRSDLYQKPANEPGAEELLWSDDLSKHPNSWSPDGRFILYYTGVSTPGTGQDLWVLPLLDRKAFPFLKTTFNELHPKFSPDGRWVAYASDESGRIELFVAPFLGPGQKTRISEGYALDWRRDGREVYYVKRGKMMAASVDGRGRTFEVGAEEPLFDMPGTGGWDAYPWDATADGKKFLIRIPDEVIKQEQSLKLVVNWPKLLTQPR